MVSKKDDGRQESLPPEVSRFSCCETQLRGKTRNNTRQQKEFISALKVASLVGVHETAFAAIQRNKRFLTIRETGPKQ